MEWWNGDEILYTKTNHILVPPHRRCTEKLSQKLPMLLDTDPIVKFYGWNSGTIISIFRINKIKGLDVVNKIVVKNQT